MKDASASDDVGFHTRLGAEYARKMFGLGTEEASRGLGIGVGNPATSCHDKSSIRLFVMIRSFTSVREREMRL
jgi:hypothetical protein